MMGVYITNMELPTDGVRVVEIHSDGKVFTRRGNKIGDAIEIASPHGNLIDEDLQNPTLPGVELFSISDDLRQRTLQANLQEATEMVQ